MASYNKRISDQSKVKFNPINRELEDSENSELDSRVDNLEENILGSKTATGNPITVTDTASVNALNLSMNLEPIQAGSGTPSPDNIRPISGRSEVAINRVGKNLFDKSTAILNKTIKSTDGTEKNDNGYFCSDYIRVTPNTTYYFTKVFGVNWANAGCLYDKNKNYIRSFTVSGSTAQSSGAYTITYSNAYYIRINGDMTAIDTVQVEKGTTATTYEPYAGKTYTIQLGDTVYGGTLDVTRGKMVVDRGYIASYNGETLPSSWISDRDVYASGTTPTTGAQVVYELATPITIQLTPQQIKLLENTNTLYTDYEGDTIHIEYLLNNAIGELLSEVEDIYNKIDDIYNKIESLDTRVTALEES